MELQEAIERKGVNVFDIANYGKNQIIVTTYQKPGEKDIDYMIRHNRNIIKAERIYKKKARLQA